MAGIDKTYTDSYEEYVNFKEWANNQIITYYNGVKENIRNFVYSDWEKEDFQQGKELPIMNTPTRIDIYLIQNCPFNFVQDRMKEVYSEESYNNYKLISFPLKLNSNYQKNRKLKIHKGKFPIKNKGINNHGNWWLQSVLDWTYDSENKIWSNYDDLLPNNTNTSHHPSVKSVIRFLKKQYLPKGLEFNLIGRYIGENYKIIIK